MASVMATSEANIASKAVAPSPSASVRAFTYELSSAKSCTFLSIAMKASQAATNSSTRFWPSVSLMARSSASDLSISAWASEMRLPNFSKSAPLSDRIRFFSARATISVCSLMACSSPMRFTLPLTALLKESLRAPRFWMAIYMPPADRATTTAKVAASFALSVSLTLRSPFFGQRRASAALQCKNTFEVRNDDEGAVALADAAHVLVRPAHADARRVLDDGGVDVGDVVHLVGQNAGNGRLTVDIDLDDDDAGILIRRRALHIEGDTQVGKRHDAAAHIDEATDEGRRSGACG